MKLYCRPVFIGRGKLCMTLGLIPGRVMRKVKHKELSNFKDIRREVGKIYNQELQRFIETNYPSGGEFIIDSHESFLECCELFDPCRFIVDELYRPFNKFIFFRKSDKGNFLLEKFSSYGFGIRLILKYGISAHEVFDYYFNHKFTKKSYKVTVL